MGMAIRHCRALSGSPARSAVRGRRPCAAFFGDAPAGGRAEREQERDAMGVATSSAV